jgi:hypothetical protein
MESELKMYKAQVEEYKYELERLAADQRALDQKYFARQRQSRGFGASTRPGEGEGEHVDQQMDVQDTSQSTIGGTGFGGDGSMESKELFQ